MRHNNLWILVVAFGGFACVLAACIGAAVFMQRVASDNDAALVRSESRTARTQSAPKPVVDSPTPIPIVDDAPKHVEVQPPDARAEAKAAAIERYERLVLEDKVGQLSVQQLKVGDIGRLGTCQVVQVIDDQNVLVRFFYAGDARTMDRGDGVRIRVGNEGGDVSLWIANRSTSGLVDDRGVTISEVMWVSGTKTYDTALGSKTVFLLEPITP